MYCILPLARKSLRSCRAHDSAGGEAGFPETPAVVTYAFDAMWDVVHLDEKWFNAEKDRLKVYVVKRQSIKRRVAKSKRFIPKVMFLAAVARPRHDDERGVMFDGKIGMWPVVKHLPAACNSRNRPAGTINRQR
ncbi:hypothetical protein DYB34_011176 [Aphanomyces astaci]|uniref:Uncharacterized protein n=1 Tax=Aphanomyces astaci TaxID=112090 RepID=A0A418BTK4_APHAT|nr:hypothetical protein DYB34_011176 [Aphanomyces astaci]